jgi:hypothetical protein
MESVSVFVPWCNEAIKIWERYKRLIKNQELEFNAKQIEIKNIASEISKYTFSLAKYQGSGIENLEPYCNNEYGYLVIDLEHIAKDAEFDGHIIYTYTNGLDTKVLKGENVGMFI